MIGMFVQFYYCGDDQKGNDCGLKQCFGQIVFVQIGIGYQCGQCIGGQQCFGKNG